MTYYIIDANNRIFTTLKDDEGGARLIAEEIGGFYITDEDLVW